MQLNPLEEVKRRLALSRRSYLGLKEIPVDRIIGSVDRSADFGRDFRPRRRLSGSRLASLRTAFPDGVMPAITVFEVGGAYFVEDGHHRVALARERGADYIDAEVTRLETSYEVGPDVDVAQLIHTEQQRTLLDESGLSRARPDAVIEFTFADGYRQLAEIIKAHGYDLARRIGGLPAPEQIAADWYDTVYRPGCDAVRRAGLPSSTPPGTPPTPISSSGFTSSVAIYARATPQSTSTWRRRTRVKSDATSAPGASSAAELADRFRNAAAETQSARSPAVPLWPGSRAKTGTRSGERPSDLEGARPLSGRRRRPARCRTSRPRRHRRRRRCPPRMSRHAGRP
jgi:hypothetical protein